MLLLTLGVYCGETKGMRQRVGLREKSEEKTAAKEFWLCVNVSKTERGSVAVAERGALCSDVNTSALPVEWKESSAGVKGREVVQEWGRRRVRTFWGKSLTKT